MNLYPHLPSVLSFCSDSLLLPMNGITAISSSCPRESSSCIDPMIARMVGQFLNIVLHASYTTALLLITLAALGVSVFALWTLQVVMRTLLHGRRK